jgi:hypothetical protein
MKVYSRIAKVSLSEEIRDQRRFFAGWRNSIFAHTLRMRCSNTIHVIPMTASSFILGRPLSVLTYTLYGASRVFTPVIPKTVGSCVDIIVILADVTKADIGT